MNITFYFQFRQKNNFTSKDYFNDILTSLDHSYNFKTNPVQTLYLPVGVGESDWISEEDDIFKVMKDGHLCCVIDELSITCSFEGGVDSITVMQHLVDSFPQATACKFNGEFFIGNPQ